MSWLTGYSKRKPITITGGASGAQTAFQLKLTVTYDGDMQSDFDDLRFTQADGETLIDAWLETKTDDTSATIWVEFPTTPANTVEQTYYLYYGNAGAASDWDGAATFIVFDDFEDALQGDWSTLAGTMDYSNTDHAYGGTQCMKVNASSRTEISVTASDNIAIRYRLWKANAALLYAWHSDAAWTKNVRFSAAEDIGYYSTAWQDTGDNIVADQWELMEYSDWDWSAHTYDITRNGATSQNDAGMWNYGARAQNAVEFENSTGGAIYVDDFIVRNYVANPPTYEFGSEESLGHPTMRRWAGIPGMQYTGRRSW